ncbi:hypothetical protein GCM10009127_13680 [Alteraurantiacibacter aestuarii]|uniref:TIGR02646 family protein n=1 Tax=Alteraurantiacibacter aestuarii TaxID=650004 RepID=A0A844ZL77_9SPHN|nr:hypothetical protein [Alteraurantiacibacter aestuarii]MXO88042.1 hypothetical protein [Alteraurantiacibacter aestuarii]
MIRIEREPTPAVLDFGDAESPAARERQAIVDYLAAEGKLPKSPKFEVYAHAQVKDVLIAMHHGKCAYCEILTSGGFDGDVEHYRPKKGITDADKAGVEHPGYWWLAMAWENLLLSCQHCNQSRRQLIHQAGLSEADIERELREKKLRTTGKKNRFPVENNAWVLDFQADMAGEHPLLLNPCDTDPEDLFEWEFERSISTVKPRGGDPRAEATIEILGLNRRFLTEARVTVLNGLRLKRKKIIDRLNRVSAMEDEQLAAELMQTVVEDMLEVKQACSAENPFAGLARAFRRKLQGEIEAMLA